MRLSAPRPPCIRFAHASPLIGGRKTPSALRSRPSGRNRPDFDSKPLFPPDWICFPREPFFASQNPQGIPSLRECSRSSIRQHEKSRLAAALPRKKPFFYLKIAQKRPLEPRKHVSIGDFSEDKRKRSRIDSRAFFAATSPKPCRPSFSKSPKAKPPPPSTSRIRATQESSS